MEDHCQANPPSLTPKQQQARMNPEYAQIKRDLTRWRARLSRKSPMDPQARNGLKRKIKEAVAERKKIPCYLPRQAIYFCRYCDDYVVVLCNFPKADAQYLKQAMSEWLQANLGVTQHPHKTRITHWSESFRFLGYNLRGQRNLNGTRWLRLTIPPEAERDLKDRVKKLCGYTQIPATDLFVSVNALMRGWAQYYCYAHNATKRFGYLTSVVFWLTAHYLGRKHRCSIKKLMRKHYGVDPSTGRRALYVTLADGKRLFIWNRAPQRRSIQVGRVYARDDRPVTIRAWAGGHSHEQRLGLKALAEGHCQHCGKSTTAGEVHHPSRLARRRRCKLGPGNVIRSAQEQQAIWLCSDCHQQRHANGRPNATS